MKINLLFAIIKINKSYYCLFDKHKSINSITIKSGTNIKLLDDCDSGFHNFFIGSISYNYIIVCINSNKIQYTIFNNEFFETLNDKNTNVVNTYLLTFPYVFTFNFKTHIICYYYGIKMPSYSPKIILNAQIMDLDLKFPICNTTSTTPKISINTAIAINIKNNINYFASDKIIQI